MSIPPNSQEPAWDMMGMRKLITTIAIAAACAGPAQVYADHYPKAPDNKSACAMPEAGGRNFTGPDGHVYMICERSYWDGAMRWHLAEETSGRSECHPNHPYRRSAVCDIPDLSHIKEGTPVYVDPSIEHTYEWTTWWAIKRMLDAFPIKVTWF